AVQVGAEARLDRARHVGQRERGREQRALPLRVQKRGLVEVLFVNIGNGRGQGGRQLILTAAPLIRLVPRACVSTVAPRITTLPLRSRVMLASPQRSVTSAFASSTSRCPSTSIFHPAPCAFACEGGARTWSRRGVSLST